MDINNEKLYRTKGNIENKERVSINLKVPKSLSIFLKDKNLSPTAIFLIACKELGWE